MVSLLTEDINEYLKYDEVIDFESYPDYPDNEMTGKKLSFSTYNREYVNMWRTYCNAKYGPVYNN